MRLQCSTSDVFTLSDNEYRDTYDLIQYLFCAIENKTIDCMWGSWRRVFHACGLQLSA